MQKRCLMLILRLTLDVLIALSLLIFVFSTIYFFHGSLEDFPTEEQQGEIKVVMSFLMILSGLLCAAFTYCRFRLKKKKSRSSNDRLPE